MVFRDRLGVSIPFEHRGKAVDVWSAGTEAQASERLPCLEVSLQHDVFLPWPVDWPRPSNEEDTEFNGESDPDKIRRIHRQASTNTADHPISSPLRNLPITQVMVSSPLPAATGIAQNVRARRHADGW